MKTSKWTSLVAGISVSVMSCAAIAADKMNAGTYAIDSSHSKVGFEIPHLVISSVEGRFNDFDGELVLGDKFDKSKVDASVDISSIDTGNQKRDEHLRSEDFFDTAKYPKMTFKSTKIVGKPTAFKVHGDLTLKGVTHPVILDGKYLGTVADGKGTPKAAFSATTKIKRTDYNLKWNKAVEAGPVVGDDVTISLKIQAAKK